MRLLKTYIQQLTLLSLPSLIISHNSFIMVTFLISSLYRFKLCSPNTSCFQEQFSTHLYLFFFKVSSLTTLNWNIISLNDSVYCGHVKYGHHFTQLIVSNDLFWQLGYHRFYLCLLLIVRNKCAIDDSFVSSASRFS